MKLKFFNQKTRRKWSQIHYKVATQFFLQNELWNIILKLGKSFLFFFKKKSWNSNISLKDHKKYGLNYISEYNHYEIWFFVFFFKSRIWTWQLDWKQFNSLVLFFFLSDAFKMILENQRENDIVNSNIHCICLSSLFVL